MFGLFGKKDPIKSLEKKYNRLIQESYRLSTSDRQASDEKRAEAEDVLQEIDRLKEEKKG